MSSTLQTADNMVIRSSVISMSLTGLSSRSRSLSFEGESDSGSYLLYLDLCVLLLQSELSVGPISSTQPNPTHQTTDPTQTSPSQSKNFWPTNQPNPQPFTQSNSILPNQQPFGHTEDSFNISQSVKVYQVLLIYQYLSLSGYQVTRPTKFYNLWKCFWPTNQPNPPKS